jgi:ribosomal protein L33
MTWEDILKRKRSQKRGSEWRSKNYQRKVRRDFETDNLSGKRWCPKCQQFETFQETQELHGDEEATRLHGEEE